jgi:hypothetical protein
MESAQGKGVREGQAPQTRREISSQPPARKEATWSRRKRKEESGVTKRNQHAQSEHLQKVFNSVFKFSLMMLKLKLCLFQENKLYDVKTICIHPLMSRHCTSLRHV